MAYEIKPLQWIQAVNWEDEVTYKAETGTGGTYEITDTLHWGERKFFWQYCFDEIRDTSYGYVNNLESAKKLLEDHWLNRMKTDLVEVQSVTLDWMPIESGLPEVGVPVLISFMAESGYPVFTKAIWCAARTLSSENYEGEDADYDENEDIYYWPEGWYEYPYEDETAHRTTVPTHWAKVKHPEKTK